MLTTVRQYLTRFVTNHRAHGWVAEDPAPRYSAADRQDGLWHADEQHQVFYTSADASGPDAPWSVYVERYASPDAAEPIAGSTHRLSSWPSEAAADREAARLAEQGLAMPVSAPPAEPEPDYRIQGHPFVPLTDQDDFCAVYVEGEGVPCGWAREDHAA